MTNKIARVLNLLGAARDLNLDVDALIDDYFGDDSTGNDSYTAIATPKIISHAMNVLLLILYLSSHTTMTVNLNNNNIKY